MTEITTDSTGTRWLRGKPDLTMAIGKCDHGSHRRHLYAWRRGTLTIDDARCTLCKRMLDKTSREAHGAWRVIDGELLVEQARLALGTLLIRRMQSREAASAYDKQGNEYGAELHRQHAEGYDNRIARLERVVAERGAA
jgi:hypothetical protein